jgi:hypothetical protein
VGRARPSGRQALATASPARGQDAASARRLHAGAKAVLPGAVTLFGLVRLLRHRPCLGSSPSGPGVPSVVDPLKARERAVARTRAGAFSVRRMIGRARSDRQTNAGRSRPATDAPAGADLCSAALRRWVPDTPGEYHRFALRAPVVGATFRPPNAPATTASPSRAEGRFCPAFPAAISPCHPRQQRVHIDLWTRSRSGALPSASSR